jgi:hypothetical protein
MKGRRRTFSLVFKHPNSLDSRSSRVRGPRSIRKSPFREISHEPDLHEQAETLAQSGQLFPRAVRHGIFFDVETYFRRWRTRRLRRWIEDGHDSLQDFHNRGLVYIQPDFEFLFEQHEFSRKFAAVSKGRAHFDKCSNDENAHLNCLRAVQNIRCHNRAVLGEGIGEIFDILTPLQGNKL